MVLILNCDHDRSGTKDCKKQKPDDAGGNQHPFDYTRRPTIALFTTNFALVVRPRAQAGGQVFLLKLPLAAKALKGKLAGVQRHGTHVPF